MTGVQTCALPISLITNLQNRQVELAFAYHQDEVKELTELVKNRGYGYITSTQTCHYIEPQFKALLQYYSGCAAQVEELVANKEIGMPILKTSIVGDEWDLNEIEPFVQEMLPQFAVVRSGEQKCKQGCGITMASRSLTGEAGGYNFVWELF